MNLGDKMKTNECSRKCRGNLRRILELLEEQRFPVNVNKKKKKKSSIEKYIILSAKVKNLKNACNWNSDPGRGSWRQRL